MLPREAYLELLKSKFWKQPKWLISFSIGKNGGRCKFRTCDPHIVKLVGVMLRLSKMNSNNLGPNSSMSVRGAELRPFWVRAPSLASNFHLHNDATECKFGCFGWKVTLCNFWGYYTDYYTFIKNTRKLLIYKVFWRAWLSVNPWTASLYFPILDGCLTYSSLNPNKLLR